MQKLWRTVLALLCFLPMLANGASYREGVDYKLLKQPIPVENSGKIEVNTVFWYGCPHCFELAQLQLEWKKNIKEDVALVETPVIFGKPWQAHAQLFYALEELGLQEKTLFALFDAVQNKGKRMDSEEEMTAFLNEFLKKDEKVKPEEFVRAFDSFGVRNQVQKASSLTRGAQLLGVPAIIVSGRYVVDPGMAGNLENMLKITDFLIGKQRKERKAFEKKAGKKAG